ncbi:hypothetical protein OF83DRAFT_1087548 [Amylostereum chailletii]|nr:hypothetical protein OF83DRAFT_1087548 [Amylostereum chailletii]
MVVLRLGHPDHLPNKRWRIRVHVLRQARTNTSGNNTDAHRCWSEPSAMTAAVSQSRSNRYRVLRQAGACASSAHPPGDDVFAEWDHASMDDKEEIVLSVLDPPGQRAHGDGERGSRVEENRMAPITYLRWQLLPSPPLQAKRSYMSLGYQLTEARSRLLE